MLDKDFQRLPLPPQTCVLLLISIGAESSGQMHLHSGNKVQQQQLGTKAEGDTRCSLGIENGQEPYRCSPLPNGRRQGIGIPTTGRATHQMNDSLGPYGEDLTRIVISQCLHAGWRRHLIGDFTGLHSDHRSMRSQLPGEVNEMPDSAAVSMHDKQGRLISLGLEHSQVGSVVRGECLLESDSIPDSVLANK